MLIGGQDRGQQRFGLMAQPKTTQVVMAQPEPEALATPQVQPVSFAPKLPLMTPQQPTSESDEAAGKILYVAAASANVREGPGKTHAVLGRLRRGEAVLLVAGGQQTEGWSLIRIEGDGIEGYVASGLLRE